MVVKEAAMICIDNSEFMRNGDFYPTRMQAQIDAIGLLCSAIIWSNPENMVGILTMAGKQVRVVISPTSDCNKLFNILQTIEIGGEANLKVGIQVAQLALKHRKKKNLHQRIIVFTGSPWRYEPRNKLEMIGSNLRKNSVALDVVNFGDGQHNFRQFDKIKVLIDATGCNINHNFAHLPHCPCLPMELMSGKYRLFTRYYSHPDYLDDHLTYALEEAVAAAEEYAEGGNDGSSQQCSSEANNNMINDQTSDDDDEEDLLQKALDLLQKVLAKSPFQI